MKKILFIIAVCSLFGSCGRIYNEPDHIAFLHSYIVNYAEYEDYSLDTRSSIDLDGVYAIDMRLDADRGYSAPEIGGEGESAAKFLEIAARHQDRTYDREERRSNYINRICSADDFTEIQVTCHRNAWDENHPDGSSLNNLITVHFQSYGNYIRSGYNGAPEVWIKKRLADVTAEDMYMMSRSIKFKFDTQPSKEGPYDIKFTLVMESGRKIETVHRTYF